MYVFPLDYTKLLQGTTIITGIFHSKKILIEQNRQLAWAVDVAYMARAEMKCGF